MSKKKLTTNAGCPVVDNQNVMTAGRRGPQLLQDVWCLEKLGHFDRENDAPARSSRRVCKQMSRRAAMRESALKRVCRSNIFHFQN